MEIGDYIVSPTSLTEVPGKIIDEDGELWVVEFGPGRLNVISKTSTDYTVIGKGDASTGWGKKVK